MRQSGFSQSFNVGELGPDAWARSDLAQHSSGCTLAWNMIGRVAGPIGRRSGTWFVGLTLDQTRRSRLVPFRRSVGDALVLEFGHLTCRVWTVNGTPVMDGADQAGFVSPYHETHLDGLRWKQIGDVIYFTHADGLRPQTLRRLSNTSWAIAPTEFADGPWRGENGDESRVLSFDGTHLTASFDLFRPGHVGGLFRLRKNDGNPGVMSWEPEEENIPGGARRLSNGRVYQRVGSADDAGNTPPVHDSGTVSDGKVNWAHVHDGAAVLFVHTVTDGYSATASAQTGVPEGLDAGTFNWAEAAYSDARGWPTAPTAVREERLVMAAPPEEPDAIDFTRTAGYKPARLDFKPGLGTGRVVDDDAVRRFVGDERNRIVWMLSSTFLMVGTTDGEFVVSGASLDDPIAPAGCVARGVGEYGSADVMPVLAHKNALFVAAGGETLRALGVAPDQSLSEGDKSVLSGHIGERGLAELTWLKQPHNLLWVRLDDGGQASFTYHAEQGVEGWSRHGLAAPDVPSDDAPLGGGLTLESSCVVPGPKGRPRLFMIASRQKNGQTQRMILRMADRQDRLFLDAAEAYVGPAVTGVAGLDHLAGEPATLMAATEAGAPAAPGPGWGCYRGRPVSGGGAALLPEGVTATRVYGGLPYLSRWEGLPPELMGPGSTAGRLVNYKYVHLTLECAEAEVGTTGEEGDSGVDPILNRRPGDVGGPVVRRKTWRSAMLGGASRDRRWFVQTDGGWDMVMHMARATAEVDG